MARWGLPPRCRHCGPWLAPEAWREVVADCSFWTEAAVLAALRNDASAFAHHVGRADRAMRQGLSLLAVH